MCWTRFHSTLICRPQTRTEGAIFNGHVVRNVTVGVPKYYGMQNKYQDKSLSLLPQCLRCTICFNRILRTASPALAFPTVTSPPCSLRFPLRWAATGCLAAAVAAAEGCLPPGGCTSLACIQSTPRRGYVLKCLISSSPLRSVVPFTAHVIR